MDIGTLLAPLVDTSRIRKLPFESINTTQIIFDHKDNLGLHEHLRLE